MSPVLVRPEESLVSLAKEVERAAAYVNNDIHVAVMGCEVEVREKRAPTHRRCRRQRHRPHLKKSEVIRSSEAQIVNALMKKGKLVAEKKREAASP